jgi:ABC-type sugar transport system permease subunit
MVIYVAAIENMPQKLIEAAQIYGASPLRRLVTITLFLTLVNSFKQFDVNVSLTAEGPSVMFMGKPIYGTELLAMSIYNQRFRSNYVAGGQARAVVFFLVFVAAMVVPFQIVMFPLLTWFRALARITGIILAYNGFRMSQSIFMARKSIIKGMVAGSIK